MLGLGFYTQSGHAVSGADFGAGEKFFFVQTLRVCGHILNAGRYFVKNATLDASAAARTAENEPEEVYLRFPKGKALPFENARECTSGRHVGAFA